MNNESIEQRIQREARELVADVIDCGGAIMFNDTEIGFEGPPELTSDTETLRKLRHYRPVIAAQWHLDEVAREVALQLQGYVYILRAGPYAKIGKASVLDRRIKQLTIQLPFKVELWHAITCARPARVEQFMHDLLAPYRQNGEWFCLPDPVLKAVKSIEEVKCIGDDRRTIPHDFREFVDFVRQAQ